MVVNSKMATLHVYKVICDSILSALNVFFLFFFPRSIQCTIYYRIFYYIIYIERIDFSSFLQHP
jgi:hypothetical protein